jgi:hypothetical protein
MTALRTLAFAAIGALTMVALHFTFNPVLSGRCIILCRPERSVLAGAALGAIVGFVYAKSLRGRKHE